ncbi:MAG TPA: hypothetical protein VI932_08320 [Bacteroidota bacterium]|nr:hypothetical protein [Bacteroidota bacterium]
MPGRMDQKYGCIESGVKIKKISLRVKDSQRESETGAISPNIFSPLRIAPHIRPE